MRSHSARSSKAITSDRSWTARWAGLLLIALVVGPGKESGERSGPLYAVPSASDLLKQCTAYLFGIEPVPCQLLNDLLDRRRCVPMGTLTHGPGRCSGRDRPLPG